MRIFITGANGFLASNIIRELLSRDHDVVAFIKEGEDISTINELNITKKYGDILDYNSILNALDECDALIHAAASTSTCPDKTKMQYRTNVEGTLNVMNAAIEKKITKVLHIGSANSFGFGTKENPGDETKPFSSGKYKLDYINTKYEAHKLVLELVRSKGLPAVILNPTFMLGPYCGKYGSGQMLMAVKNRKLPGYTSGGRNFIYVKDAAVAIVNALTMGKTGECYILGNENLYYKEIFNKMAAASGLRPIKRFIPGFAIILFGLIITGAAKIFGFTPAITYRTAKVSMDTNFYTANKAIRDLKLLQTPVDIAIKEAYHWLETKQMN